MRNIEIVVHGYDKEREYLKQNMHRITHCVTSLVPNVRGIVQVEMRSGDIREYHGLIAKQVFNYLN
jgi:hypothetical protein